MAKKKIRPLGDITTDMEKYLFEMFVDHELQKHEVFGIIDKWVDAHVEKVPDAQEYYLDGTKPVLQGTFYGPKKKRRRK